MKSEEIKYNILKSIRGLPAGSYIYSVEIENKYQLSGPSVRDMIRELRREGHPIVGSSKGYYLGNVLDTADDLERRAYDMLKTASSLRKNFKPQQLKIF